MAPEGHKGSNELKAEVWERRERQRGDLPLGAAFPLRAFTAESVAENLSKAFFFFLFLVVLGFELRALCLLGRHSTT
jgi:hypothetical protein